MKGLFQSIRKACVIAMSIIFATSCNTANDDGYQPGSFGYDFNFLKQYGDPVLLFDGDSSSVLLVSPEYQGRVMTSSAKGMKGRSYGWLNYDLISSQQILPQFNPFGGEDRFWMGPEGGQFGLFFSPGEPFDWDHWKPPYPFDKDTFKVVETTPGSVLFKENFDLVNYQGKQFSIELERRIVLLPKQEIIETFNIEPAFLPIDIVGFKSINTVTNSGLSAWSAESGKLSAWILGVFMPSEKNIVIIPLKNAEDQEVHEVVNTDYYWHVPAERLLKKENMLFFKGDGNYQCKIGIKPEYATSVTGSYDPVNQVLTVVKYTCPGREAPYVNSLLEYQEEPYDGDVLNFYNDGIPVGGEGQYGPFYEIETSSPALGLFPGDRYTHIHETYHFQGSIKHLSQVAVQVLGTDIATIPEF